MSTSINRLQHETSPYLQQHARNPVDWHPWDETALQLAREQDKPIFLSIGYSACHWCHVMEHESFENPAIAQLMNAGFVNIKVDREERPDLDQIYMNAVMAMTGSGGWPMSVFLTPDLRPFYGGTYWPPQSKWGRPGFPDILKAVHNAWHENRDGVLQQAEQLTAAVIQAGRPALTLEELTVDSLQSAEAALLRSADRTHGGFGSAPKFPHPMDLRVLLRTYRRFGNPDALKVVCLTLDKMAAGGIYDHLGGGFARYSTDERWLVPHFEKMLYDNALLVPAYLEAWQVTQQPAYARIVHETLQYILREMTQPEGGFYSTQDADSEGVEGKFFVWSRPEILQELGADVGELFCAAYDVSDPGNWEHTNILNTPRPLSVVAQEHGLSLEQLEQQLAAARTHLFERRSHRIPPARDDKVLASWNGLMIAAMAQAARVLDTPVYAAAAKAAADFILQNLQPTPGRLLHAFKDGRARFNGYLDDYAAMIDGLVELYQTTFEDRYLAAAVSLAENMLDQFWDAEDAGFFYTARDHETLIARNKEIHDNATPSGNNHAATALQKLSRLTGRTEFGARAEATIRALAATILRAPTAAGQALIALDDILGPSYEVVLSGPESEIQTAIRELEQRFIPNKVVAVRPAGLSDEQLPAVLQPLLTGKGTASDQLTVAICQSGACQRPLSGPAALEAIRQLSQS